MALHRGIAPWDNMALPSSLGQRWPCSCRCRKDGAGMGSPGVQSCRQGWWGSRLQRVQGTCLGLGQPLTYFSPPTLQRPARRSSRSPPWPRGHFCWRHRRSTRYGLLPRYGSCLRRGGWGGSDANCCQRYPAVMGRGRSRRSLLGPRCQGEGSLGPWSQGCWGSQGSP